MINNFSKVPVPVSLVVIGILLFVPFLGNAPLFDWDEINFAESAREMILTENYWKVQVNFEPFWEKPPLFIWLQVVSMKLLGVTEEGARMPNAIFGIATLLMIYQIGKSLYNRTFGFFWVLAYCGSFLPHFYFKSGIIDPVFNFFIFLSIFFIHKLSADDEFVNKKIASRRRMMFSILSGLFAGVAVLTKGPVALLLIVLTALVYFFLSKGGIRFNIKELLVWTACFLIATFVWYGYETVNSGFWFLKEFIQYQFRLLTTEDAGHGGPFFYHFVVLLIGVFPASVFVFRAFKKHESDTLIETNFKKWMIALLLVVLIVFSIVQTKILHYSSLAYFPLTYLAAHALYYLKKDGRSIAVGEIVLLAFLGLIWSLSFIIAPIVGKDPSFIIPYINDPFAVANLDARVFWSNFDSGVGVFLFVGILVSLFLMRKGRIFAGATSLFIVSCLTINMVISLFTPRIEKYSQHAAIEFYQNKMNEDCYIEVLGFKSYAHLFYSGKEPGFDAKSRDKQWLLTGAIDKEAYFVTKNVNAKEFLSKYPVEELYRKNGYVFLKRLR